MGVNGYMVHWKSALSNWLLIFDVYLADTKTCGSPQIRRLPASLHLPAGKHGDIITYLQRKVNKKTNKKVMGQLWVGEGNYEESRLKMASYGSTLGCAANLSRADLKAIVTSDVLFLSVCSTVIRTSRVLAPALD